MKDYLGTLPPHPRASKKHSFPGPPPPPALNGRPPPGRASRWPRDHIWQALCKASCWPPGIGNSGADIQGSRWEAAWTPKAHLMVLPLERMPVRRWCRVRWEAGLLGTLPGEGQC